MRKAATISSDGKYRYRLSRHWSDEPEVTFVMLNPSTADAERDDATIRKCVGFAKRWEMGGIYVGNLFAVRATNPEDMKQASDPVGSENYDHLSWMCERAEKNGGLVVCAWGTHGAYLQQDQTFIGWCQLSWAITPMVLRKTAAGHPGHPLYIPYEQMPSRYF